MTSTFTTNKSIEKPGNGDYVNDWNVPVNTDWNIIDQAFGGTTSLNVTGVSTTPVNLTINSVNAALSYQSLLLTISGTLSNNVTYTIPSGVGGQWIVANGTTGAFNVIIASLGGGTSYAPPQGYKTIIVSDGTNITAAITTPVVAPSIPSGSTMLFVQTSAPTGWTKITTYNDVALRVVNGTAGSGGSVNFSAAFSSQTVSGSISGTALDITQIPPHTHIYQQVIFPQPCPTGAGGGVMSRGDVTSAATGSTGSGLPHTHTFTGTNINLAVSYVDTIICQKN